MKTIFLLTNQSPQKVEYWSGIPHHSKKWLEKDFNVIDINPGEFILARLLHKIFAFARRRFNLKYNYQHSYLSAAVYWPYTWYKFNVQYRKTRGVILAEAVSSELIFITKKHKIILFADATFAQLMDQYSWYSGLSNPSKMESRWIDQQSLRKADHCIFTSSWARDAAVLEAKLTVEKTSIRYFGSNLPDRFNQEEVRKRLENKTLRFLFPSTDWVRKGGQEAIDFLSEIRQKTSLQVELIIFGLLPEKIAQNQISIRELGWIDKLNSDQLDQLIEVFQTSDFMILPTKADCTPVAISEAFCYGIPVISTAIGGIPELLNQPKTGFILTAENRQTVQDEILLIAKKEQYVVWSEAARLRYDSELNWEVWLQHIHGLISSI